MGLTFEDLQKNSVPSLSYIDERDLNNDFVKNYFMNNKSLLPNCRSDWNGFNCFVDKQFEYPLTPYGWALCKDRFLLKNMKGELLESPKFMLARVANALADDEDEAIAFFKAMYQRKFMPSSPILFNAGTEIQQLSSCYIHTVPDSLDGIFKSYADMGKMGKYAGGIATDWTYVRGLGALIEGTKGTSTGLIPWLKIQDNVCYAVNQGGRRPGAHCAYLEVWHNEIFEFVKLRKQIGDENRIVHHLHTAVWIPDAFMEAVMKDEFWYLFCPSNAENLHELYGIEFAIKYSSLVDSGAYERRIKAKELWQFILTHLYETGHPWITFKDTCNEASGFEAPILSSNLCTEITLPTAFDNTAVCTLASLNLANLKDTQELIETVKIAIGFLNKVIKKSWYPTREARYHSQRYAPLGLGVMGYQDALQQRGIAWGSEAHKYYDNSIFSIISKTAKRCSQGNSTLTAIAPTATISHLVGVSPSIEPYYENIYTVEGKLGKFVLANPQWLKANQPKNDVLYKTAFELEQELLVEACARRQKYICQSQSLNLYVNYDDGKRLSDLYTKAWMEGVKTTYYLRTKAASKAEGVCELVGNNELDCQVCQ